MKPISIVLSPTRSRPLNVFLGLMLLLVSLLLLLSLATWHATDPSLNTASGEIGPHAVHNWIGLFGAWLGDLLLQSLGFTAFLLPVWLGGLGWTWLHSRPGGSPWLRWTGTLFALVFLPAVFGLLPWHWRWLHALPVEGVLGQLMSALLVGYVNIQGAWLIAGILAAAGLYFASAVSFWAIKESIEERWIHLVSWNDRWRNWREERAERKAERESQREAERADAETGKRTRPSRLANLFRRNRVQEQYLDPNAIDDIPAFQRAPMPTAEDEAADPARKPSIWERSAVETPIPQSGVPILRPRSIGLEAVPVQPQPTRPEPAPIKPGAPEPALSQSKGLASETWETSKAPSRAPEPIAIHGRADSEVRTATVAPKSVSGF